MIGAIIVEYNPLHNGHIYHIDSTLSLLNDAYPDSDNHIVAIMSGGFCQRGEPAVLNKYTRTKHALLNGVDMVIELPSIYATSSAEYFAKGAIEVISKLSNVGLICFGSESGNITELNNICDIMLRQDYNLLVKSNIDKGLSYPASSARALIELGVSDEGLLSSPNNTLAIEYIKQIRKLNITADIATIKRQGAGYHDTDVDTSFASATAIRKCLSDDTLGDIESQVMPSVYCDLANANIDYNKLYGVISSCALDTKLVYEDNEGVINRIKRGIEIVDCYEELVDYAHTKRYTKSRIKRILIHLALKHFEIDINRPIGKVKVLGVKANCKSLLSLVDHDGDSYHFDMDTNSNIIYNIVSRDKIISDKMLIID